MDEEDDPAGLVLDAVGASDGCLHRRKRRRERSIFDRACGRLQAEVVSVRKGEESAARAYGGVDGSCEGTQDEGEFGEHSNTSRTQYKGQV